MLVLNGPVKRSSQCVEFLRTLQIKMYFIITSDVYKGQFLTLCISCYMLYRLILKSDSSLLIIGRDEEWTIECKRCEKEEYVYSSKVRVTS